MPAPSPWPLHLPQGQQHPLRPAPRHDPPGSRPRLRFATGGVGLLASSERVCPSPLSSVAAATALQPMRWASLPRAVRGSAWPTPTCGPLPLHGVSSTCPTWQAPASQAGGRGGSQVSVLCCPAGHVAEGRMAPGAVSCGRGSRRGAVGRAGRPTFQGAETRSSPLPLDTGLSRSGTVSRGTHRQALVGPLMVELFAVGCFGRTPGGSGPVAPVARNQLPTPVRVERARLRVGPGPPWWD